MKLTLPLLKASITTYVATNKISVETFQETRDNTVGLLDTIGKIFWIPNEYIDKLSLFDGEDLSFGKTIEEWAADLILPEDYDASGEGALKPHRSTFRPVSFSFTLGRKKISQTIDYNDVERAVHNEAQFAEIIAAKYKVINDSETLMRYQIKKEGLAVLIARCIAQMDASQATAWTDAAHSTVNALFKANANATDVYLLVKPYKQGDADNFADAIAKGFLVKMELVTEIAKPVDTSTGEAFVRQLKKDVEVAGDASEGHSLNGNTLGVVSNQLVLIKGQGIAPILDVDVMAGAFHEDKVSLPAESVTINGFGSDNTGTYAILCDKRIMRLHNTYRAVRDNGNGDGDWLNLFAHSEWTLHVSRNCFVKVYKPVSE